MKLDTHVFNEERRKSVQGMVKCFLIQISNNEYKQAHWESSTHMHNGHAKQKQRFSEALSRTMYKQTLSNLIAPCVRWSVFLISFSLTQSSDPVTPRLTPGAQTHTLQLSAGPEGRLVTREVAADVQWRCPGKTSLITSSLPQYLHFAPHQTRTPGQSVYGWLQLQLSRN